MLYKVFVFLLCFMVCYFPFIYKKRKLRVLNEHSNRHGYDDWLMCEKLVLVGNQLLSRDNIVDSLEIGHLEQNWPTFSRCVEYEAQ